MNLKEKRAAALKTAQNLLDEARHARRELTSDEQATIEGIFAEIKGIDSQLEAAAKSTALLDRLAGFEVDPAYDPYSGTPTGSKSALAGSKWAKAVTSTLARTASGMGVKALLNGEIAVPPAVEIVPLPETPRRLLDLVQREPMDSNTYQYLRQVVRTNNAAVVPDNALKPTSIYTFDEIEDRARVVAHLSEPFPLRYLTDYASMAQVLDTEMREGVLQEVERQLLSGDGVGENFTGLLQLTGVTDVPFTTDILTTVRTARTVLENKGETPTGWVLNPTDAATLELTREGGATGAFLMAGGAWDVIFGEGVTRTTSTAVPQGTALLADWRLVKLGVRETEHTLAATQAGDLFSKNQVMLRSEGRYAPKFYRPQAVAVVHLTAA